MVVQYHVNIKNYYHHPFLIAIYFAIYLTFGFYTELRLIEIKPIPEFLMEDFRYYENALQRARLGINLYQDLTIGTGYLYPPPALFVVEIFNGIEPLLLKALAYAVTNIILLFIIVFGLSKYYGYKYRQIWYLYVLVLFFAPFLELIHIGQINVVTLFGIFMLCLWSDKYPYLGGLGLAIAVLTKVSPVIFLVYLISCRYWRCILFAVLFIILGTVLSTLRYGFDNVVRYPEVLAWLSTRFPMGYNSQSLVSKIVPLYNYLFSVFDFQISFLSSSFSIHQIIQYLLMVYIVIVVGCSAIIYLISGSNRELFFAVVCLAMAISPNVMWYHHYVFILLPILIWMVWSQVD